MIFLYIAGGILLLILLYFFLLAPRLRKKSGLAAVFPKPYAHRGLHGSSTGFPENSLSAFQEAVNRGFGIELDVHLASDGALVVMHDEDLLRTCGVSRKIFSSTRQELSAFHLEGTQEPIPFLEQVLQQVHGQVPLLLELKTAGSNAGALCEAVCLLLDHYQGPFCVESFDPRVLLWLKKHRPNWIRGQLSMKFEKDSGLPFWIRFPLGNLLTNFLTKPDFIAYHFQDRKKLSPWLCRKGFHCPEFSWTITQPSWEQQVEKEKGCCIFEGYLPGCSEELLHT